MSFIKKSTVNLRNCLFVGAVVFASQNVVAESGNSQDVMAKIKSNLESSLPSAKVSAVSATPMEAIYQIDLESGEVVYSNQDASFIIAGQLFQLKAGSNPVNITEASKGKQRIQLLEGLDTKDMVVFAPAGDVKGVVYAFTDPDCGYCQKLHEEVPAMNELGIEVRYLAWPRAGLESPTGEKMKAIWCAADRNAAMTKAKRRLALETPPSVCVTPIAQQIELGHKMGVRGTPALYLANGEHAGGYMKAADLASRLGIKP